MYRMSEAGYCPRVLAADRLGYDPIPETPTSLNIMREGQRQEEWVIEDLQKEYSVYSRQQEVTIDTPLFTLRGHIDGIARDTNKEYLLEIKSMGRFVFQKYQNKGLPAFPEYEAQLTCYMEALQLPALFVTKCRDTGDMPILNVEKPPMLFSDIIDKLNLVEVHVSDGSLPVGVPNDNCRWCKYRYLCIKQEDKEEAKIENLPPLLEAAQLYEESKKKLEEINENIEYTKSVLLQHSITNQIDKYRVHNLSISYRGERTKTWLDEKTIRELATPDIVEKATRVSKPYTDYTIKILKT